MSVIDNERTKLLANAFDRASTACFTVGIVTPAAGYAYNIADFGKLFGWPRLALTVAAWLIVAVTLHWIARRILKGLKQ